jgi:hypothetical protein
MEVSGQLDAPAALPPDKELWYPLNRWLTQPHSRFGCFEQERNLLSLTVFEPRIVQHVPQPLYLLSYPGSTGSSTKIGEIQTRNAEAVGVSLLKSHFCFRLAARGAAPRATHYQLSLTTTLQRTRAFISTSTRHTNS